ncbi:spore coat protein [Paenibacillus sp. GD4]|uniref:spore coat protein n=1 Tax=Paenibacillus sp. GD4 TaxID=3068890 RepID=UPI0027969D7F|nr:spore coat protein [Paenibacillus sp. GD4]MDQ1910103.1 spore coat protein [Paenibacillus sp. GD4]
MSPQSRPNHLAWHETLELHELVAFQTSQLVSFKKKLPSLQDRGLYSLYSETVKILEKNLTELLQFYPKAPEMRSSGDMPELLGAESAQLLAFAKTAVRNYAIAITETATPQLRAVFQKQLIGAIELHGKVFQFMYERGLYPAYDLKALLANDVTNAKAAISL